MKIVNSISGYFKTNKLIFLTVIFVFIFGVVAGGYSLVTVPGEDLSHIRDYTDRFFSTILINPSDFKAVFLKNFFDDFKLITLIWISGFFVFLTPVSLIQLFFKGFRTGFTIAYLTGVYKLKGITFSLLNYFTGNLIFLPLIIFFTVYSIKNAVKKYRRFSRKNFSFNMLITYAICVLITFLLSLFDGYILSFALKFASAINL